jgi:hypothetical protein
MIQRSVRCAVAAIVLAAALGAVPAIAENTTPCPHADPPNAGISVNGKDGQKYVVTSASGLTAMSPDGTSFIKAFGYLYTTRGAGPYVQDGAAPPAPIFSVAGTDAASIRKGLSALAEDPSGYKPSNGARAIVSRGWSLVVFSCNPLQ